MKKLNLFERGLRRVLFLLLSLLGFTSCDSDSHDSPCEYGSPTAKYKVIGKVINEDGAGIPNIGIVFKSYGYPISLDTLRTDTNGAYSGEFRGSRESELEFIDTDGSLNGSYQNAVVRHLTPTDDIKKKDGRWITIYKDQEINATLVEKENN